jgi:hypothetical protein
MLDGNSKRTYGLKRQQVIRGTGSFDRKHRSGRAQEKAMKNNSHKEDGNNEVIPVTLEV